MRVQRGYALRQGALFVEDGDDDVEGFFGISFEFSVKSYQSSVYVPYQRLVARLITTILVAEVAGSGEEHGDVMLVRGGDYFIVADGAAGLGDGGDAAGRRHFDVVGEGEEGVGCEDAALAPCPRRCGGRDGR